MSKMKQKSDNTQTIKTKQDLSLHVIGYMLEIFQQFMIYYKDEELHRLFQALEDYVTERLSTPYGEVNDIYVVIEQSPN